MPALKILLILLACGTAAALATAARVRTLPPAARPRSPVQAALRAGLLAVVGAGLGIAVALWRIS